jgi:hypothetical protein
VSTQQQHQLQDAVQPYAKSYTTKSATMQQPARTSPPRGSRSSGTTGKKKKKKSKSPTKSPKKKQVTEFLENEALPFVMPNLV